ncbi:hypothetical protein [Pseudomonas syringae group genomosp. 3]|uniref:Lipoprotein n=1 Tax=Pseudomonas syringae pv. coriandricola TaxID=264453 RepID=A0A3M3JFN2_9PSED|nr:hypothetical protein [Pseudomonas syringae group genomosp. 3]RMN09035.1 hypothetical protein ALQ65_01655 [Pseudomonas syringae pv. coriandricola]
MKIIAKLILATASTFLFSGQGFCNPQSYNITTTPEAAYLEAESDRMVDQAIETIKAKSSNTSDAWVRMTVIRYVNKQLTCMGSEAPSDQLECKQNKEEFTQALIAATKL